MKGGYTSALLAGEVGNRSRIIQNSINKPYEQNMEEVIINFLIFKFQINISISDLDG